MAAKVLLRWAGERQPSIENEASEFSKEQIQMKANAARIVVLFFLGITITSVMSASALAQSQIQGMTAGSPGPPHNGGDDSKALHDNCAAQAKDKVLKGHALRAFMKECETKK